MTAVVVSKAYPIAPSIQVYGLTLSDLKSFPDLAAHSIVLSPFEQKKHDDLMKPELRHRYRVGRLFLRLALSHVVTRVSPQSWVFAEGADGKPFIQFPELSLPVDFNLSHTKTAWVCAIAHQAIGIDLEKTDRPVRYQAMAKRFFHPEEWRTIMEVPEASRKEMFFRFWTLKESYFKARGTGLQFPLSAVHFAWEGENLSVVGAEPGWHWGLWRWHPDHHLAICSQKSIQETVFWDWNQTDFVSASAAIFLMGHSL